MQQTVTFHQGLKTQMGETAALFFFFSLHVSAQSNNGSDTFVKDLNSTLISFGWWTLTKEQIIVGLMSLSLFLSAWAQNSRAGSHSSKNRLWRADIFISISKINYFFNFHERANRLCRIIFHLFCFIKKKKTGMSVLISFLYCTLF